MGTKVANPKCDHCGEKHSVTINTNGTDKERTKCKGCGKTTSWTFKNGKLQ